MEEDDEKIETSTYCKYCKEIELEGNGIKYWEMKDIIKTRNNEQE